ncbi:hypothetical protein B484DRAFT_455497 [Ochromonadaceae sp. CCMP2298]|nr:hypothetical protein B484DRAFT_455497 [Ochromonadaceae sp. CCMP2298]
MAGPAAFLIALLLLQCLARGQAHLFQKHDHRLSSALRFIDSVQQPKNCTGHEYALVSMGINGGFAAQFQLTAREWMVAFSALNFSVPVLIDGRLIGYSDSKACDHAKHEWTCYFQPMSSQLCQQQLLATGRRVRTDNLPWKPSPVPPQFEQLGLAFWWGAVQHKMFRLQPVAEEFVLLRAQQMNGGGGFPFGLPIAGLHVRHGDKGSDGFKEHSLDEELGVLGHSPDCSVRNRREDCFCHMGNEHALLQLMRAAKTHTPVLNASQAEHFNRSASEAENAPLLLDPQLLLSAAHQELQHPQHPQLSHPQHSHHSHAHPKLLGPEQWVTLVPVFVASDDGRVLSAAASRGFLCDPSGVSQDAKTASEGMLKTLLSHPEKAHQASLEIITDVYLLSQCSSLVGVSASQVFRMAVALSNATGTLRFAAALDRDQISRVQQLSRKYDVPFPEHFFLDY